MRYTKTVTVDEAHEKGWKFQRGQWISNGGGKPGRFVGLRDSGSVWVVWPSRDGREDRERFSKLCKTF